MEHLAPVVASLELAKTNLERELEVVNQMLGLTEQQNPALGQEEGGRWGGKNGAPKLDDPKPAGPKPAAVKKKKAHPVQDKIITDLLERVRARKPAGKSFTPEIPGSVTAQELVSEAGYSIGTVRRAIQQLEKQGAISTRRMSWKELGKEKPAGPTVVIVATEA